MRYFIHTCAQWTRQTCPLSKVVPIFISHTERRVEMNQSKLLTPNLVTRPVKNTQGSSPQPVWSQNKPTKHVHMDLTARAPLNRACRKRTAWHFPFSTLPTISDITSPAGEPATRNLSATHAKAPFFHGILHNYNVAF